MDTLISATVLKKNAPAFFLTMSHLFFIAIFWPVLKEFFSWKQLSADYSKNIWKEKKMRTRFSLSLGWLHICANELLKTAVMLLCWVQVLIKQEKQLVFGRTLTLFSRYSERKTVSKNFEAFMFCSITKNLLCYNFTINHSNLKKVFKFEI